MKGKFITFEGPEGAGKTSVLEKMYYQFKDEGLDVIKTREPGGIKIAEKIREIILNPTNTEMEERTEALLYAAARRQHLVEKVLPALEEGKIVLCDRFIDSSLAYQGYARGLGIEEVYEINKFAIKDTMPGLTLFFDLSPEKGLERIASSKQREKNRLDLENLHFHEKVYKGYQLLLNKFPNRFRTINADQSFQHVFNEAYSCISSYIK